MDRDYEKRHHDKELSDIDQGSEQDKEHEKALEEEPKENRAHNDEIESNIQSNEQEAVDEKINDRQYQTHDDQSDRQLQRKTPIKWGSFLRMLAAAILGSVLTLGTITQLDYFQPNGEVPEQDVAPASTEQVDDSTVKPVTTSGSVADIVDDASDAIVGIVNMSEQQNPFTQTNGKEVERGVGSGVIYKVTEDTTYIVTNNHVIEGASSLQVSLENGETVDGELVGADPLTDIAVVKIKGNYDIEPIEFGDSDKLRAGDQVIAIGNPLSLDLSRTVTQGIVSATDRTIPVQTSAGEWEFDVIQTDAAINPGNSGGALLNAAGQLVGINSLKIANSRVEGLGFSIPSNEVKDLIDQLAEDGQIVRPYVGVGIKSVDEIPPYYLQDLPDNVENGAVVLSIDEQSAAAKAGIEVEDIIVGIDGEEVKNDKDFRSYLYKQTSIGDKIEIELYHEGEKKTVELELTSNADVS